VNPFRAQDVSRLMSTHPPMAERIARLQHLAYGYRVNPRRTVPTSTNRSLQGRLLPPGVSLE